MTEWEVLVPREIAPAGPESIADFATCTGMDEYASHEAAVADIERYDAVIVRVAPLDAAVLDRADNLQVIAKQGSGLDNDDIAAAARQDIVVCNTPGANARSVAEHSIGLIFGLARHLRGADRHVRSGGWNRSDFTGTELRGKTVGVVGLGTIGLEVARTATASFGADVVGYDPYVTGERSHPVFPRHDRGAVEDAGVELVDRERLFERADVVTVHTPLTEETRGLVGDPELDGLGEGYLVNTSRGGVIEESALYDALVDGELAGAALDVFENEPPSPDNPLLDAPNLILRPHVAGGSDRTQRRGLELAAESIRTALDGGRPDTVVNPAVYDE